VVAAGTNNATLTSPFVYGKFYGDTVEYLNGNADDMRIYNRALSATEVKQLYNAGR